MHLSKPIIINTLVSISPLFCHGLTTLTLYAQRSGSWLVCYIQKLFKILYRSPTLLKVNKVLIRPNLEYAGVVWDPYLVKDIVVIENVQKFALATGLLQAVEL